MPTAREALAFMGYDPDVAIDKHKQLREDSRADKRVCRCGHPMSRHKEDQRNDYCSVGRMKCHCSPTNKKAVLTASSLRSFRYRSNGPNEEHAIIRGIADLASKGGTVEIITEAFVCGMPDCGVTENLVPVVIQSAGQEGPPLLTNMKAIRWGNHLPGWRDRFLCPTHFEEIKS
jgi:hypothetical protein